MCALSLPRVAPVGLFDVKAYSSATQELCEKHDVCITKPSVWAKQERKTRKLLRPTLESI